MIHDTVSTDMGLEGMRMIDSIQLDKDLHWKSLSLPPYMRPNMGPFSVIEYMSASRHVKEHWICNKHKSGVAYGTKQSAEFGCEKLNLIYAEWLMTKPDNPLAVQCPKCKEYRLTTGRISSWCGNCGQIQR